MRDCSRNFHPALAWETMRTHSAADIAFGQNPAPDQPESGLSISQMKGKIPKSPGRAKIVFLFDVDNTLLNNDQVIADLTKYLKREVGPRRARCYWAMFEQLRTRLGYADYLGALQRYRSEYPHDLGLLAVSRFLINYPFANRLFPNSLDVVERVKQWGTTVLLTDGDVVFQPRKVECSGLFETVNGNVLIYVHKERELDDVAKRFPADHYVMVDDKLRILTAVKKLWGAKVTTVFVRQGHYALDAKLLAQYPAADVTLERIGEFDPARL
jgi:FMN phosphatase YigB (HAD superfamily)